MGKIIDIKAREVLDSRGNPTVEAEVIIETGQIGTGIVPSGASTGVHEALELRDNDERYLGKGVLKAVNNILNIIKPKLIGMDSLNQELIDKTMIELDGTENKSRLGANAILAVSIANAHVISLEKSIPLYEVFGSGKLLPIAMMNIFNGGMHADNNLDFQEFMIVPMSSCFQERLRIGTEVFHNLKKVLKEKGYSTAVGDEGGFAPSLSSNTEALDLILEAINKAGYIKGIDVNIALDVAASSFYDSDKDVYSLAGENKTLTRSKMINYYEKLITKYPIISIEDPFHEEDFEGFKILTERLGDKIQIVGDDLFVTNTKLLQKGIDNKAGNAILIKVNQIGTITETINCIKLAQANNYGVIVSHRSGETEDTTIADLTVGMATGQIKTGSLSRSERVCKYNRLLKIEEELNGN